MRRLVLFFALLCLAAALPVTAHSRERIVSPSKHLSVPVSKGVYISLPDRAGTVFIAEPEIASFQVLTEDKLLVFGRLPGQTSLFAVNAAGEPIYSATISVQYDTVQMEAALKRDFPSLTLKLTPAADGIMVSGDVPSAQVAVDVVALLDSFMQIGRPSVENLAASQGAGSSASSSSSDEERSGSGTGTGTLSARHGKVINRLRVTMPTQVTIRVRVAEVSRNVSEKLGINWQIGKNVGLFGSSFLLGGVTNTLFTTMPSANGITGTGDAAALIDALAQENLVSILAEPNLSVASGETASFLAGGQLPFPVLDGENVGIEFRDFGVLLGVTPTILSPQRISLRLRPEVSEPDTSNGITIRGTTIPGFTIRRAETTVELASGQSFAIGGLLQNSMINEINKIPGLGDVPILGALARSNAFKRGETELVIIATAYIAEPADGPLRIPNAQLYVPGVFERLLLGTAPEAAPGYVASGEYLLY